MEKNLTESIVFEIVKTAIEEGRPLVAVLGQRAGWKSERSQTIEKRLLGEVGLQDAKWADIPYNDIGENFFKWLEGKLINRKQETDLLSLSNLFFTGVFSSHFDPTLRNLFKSEGRNPKLVISYDSNALQERSEREPVICHMFGLAGTGPFNPPITELDLIKKRSQANLFLKSIDEFATPLGLVLIDGFDPLNDWIDTQEMLLELSKRPKQSVLWFGGKPKLTGTLDDLMEELVLSERVIFENSTLGELSLELDLKGISRNVEGWDEAGVISFNNSKLIVGPELRLLTEASAQVVDDSWLHPLETLDDELEKEKFKKFHSVPESKKVVIEGIRRGYAIKREFEGKLSKLISKSLNQPLKQTSAILLGGQSGTGKSIAIARAISEFKIKKECAILFCRDIPSARELAHFVVEVEKLGKTTLIFADALARPETYNSLLKQFHSRAHRVVVVGTCYSSSYFENNGSNIVTVLPTLTKNEQEKLQQLSTQFFDKSAISPTSLTDQMIPYFFWKLPHSRASLASGLGREAISTEKDLASRGSKKIDIVSETSLSEQLINLGYNKQRAIFADVNLDETHRKALKLIDHVMVCSRVNCWVPINLLLRSNLSSSLVSEHGISAEILKALFDGHDLFRWKSGHSKNAGLLVGARLQIEAKLISDSRFSGATDEAQNIIELISSISGGGPDRREEIHFVADLVQKLGPDGIENQRYRSHYYQFAQALTAIREKNGVIDGRLMLQETTLRRNYFRYLDEQSIGGKENKISVLEEAREIVEQALSYSNSNEIYIPKRTVQNFWVEKAAVYGLLASSAARRGENEDIVIAAYKAAKKAIGQARIKVDSYFPLDVALWVPTEILEGKTQIDKISEIEIQSDLIDALDLVDESDLTHRQKEKFNIASIRVSKVLGDSFISEEAYEKLLEIGSKAGYFFHATHLAGRSLYERDTPLDYSSIENALNFLQSNYSQIDRDARCLRLYLKLKWIVLTKQRLFETAPQPLPCNKSELDDIYSVLNDLRFTQQDQLSSKFSYLLSTTKWLQGRVQEARKDFKQLADLTEFVDSRRILLRHFIADSKGEPTPYSGIIKRKVNDKMWSAYVPEIDRDVDVLISQWNGELYKGKEITNFAVYFGYIGSSARQLNVH